MDDEIENKEDLRVERIESEVEDSESEPKCYEIASYPADYTLEVLHQKWKSGDIVIPEFQRKFVWKLQQASRLIESFMLGLPVPQIFIYTNPVQKSLIVDGQQRLKSIFFFFEGFYGDVDSTGKRKVFRLEGLNEGSKWINKTFNDFSDSDKRKLKDSVLRAIIIKQLNPKDDTSMYYIFERLNTGGTLLKNQEVRNCIYWGKFNALLVELNKYSPWRKIIGKQKEDSRQRDIELILRYISLFHNGAEYEKPMKEFMSAFMRQHRDPTEDFIDKERNQFKKTCDLIVNTLGEKPFHPRRALNAAVFDSVFLAFSKHINSCPDDVKQQYALLLQDKEFDKCTRSGTTDIETVRTRLDVAEKMLFTSRIHS